MKAMKLKEMNGANYLSYSDFYPVVRETKTFAIISIRGFEKKVMLSTGKYPRAFKNDPVFLMVTFPSIDQLIVDCDAEIASCESLIAVCDELLDECGRGSCESVPDIVNNATVTKNQSEPFQGVVTVTENADMPVKRGRGRPVTGQALSSAERQAAYRARQKEKNVTMTINRDDVVMLSTLLNAAKFYGPRTGVEVDVASVQRLIDALDHACSGQVLKGA